jgi:hypothetical protein
MLNNLEITYAIQVKSNENNSAILLNGVDVYKTTPETILIKLSQLYIEGSATITVKKEGYVSNERYVLKVIENPNFVNYIGDVGGSATPSPIATRGTKIVGTGDDIDKVEQDVSEVPLSQINNPSYSNIPQYVIGIEYYNGNRPISYTYVPESQFQSVEFNLIKSISDTISTETTANITVNLTGIDNSLIVLNDSGETFTLNVGSNIILGDIGTYITVLSSDDIQYRITEIESIKGDIVNVTIPNEKLPVIVYRFLVDGDETINVSTERIFLNQIELPKIEFADINTGVYNINEKLDVPIGIVKQNDVSSVIISVNTKQFTFSDLGDTEVFIALIPYEVFDTIGIFSINFTPLNQFGSGESIQYNLNVIDGIYVGFPDIRNITYPSLIQGPDYIGFDVNFDINWESINTDYIKLTNNNSTNYIQLNPSGPQTFNFKNLLEIDGGTYEEDINEVSIVLNITPFNISGRELIEGKTEVLNIRFIKGNLSIPRNVAINRIVDGFFNQLEIDVFNDETSKYLTHALHIGDADNKVITTWTGSLYNDVPSLIVKLYEPLSTTIQPNQQVWISKYQSNPILETVTLSDENVEFCTPLKGPNFSIDIDNGIGYRIFDDLVGSNSVESSAQLINKYAISLGIDLTKLNIRYKETDGVYLFSNFVNFSSAEERINNFIYKLKTIEDYESKISSIMSISSWQDSIELFNTVNRYNSNITTIKNGFDGFELYMYNGDYPYIGGNPVLVDSDDGKSWYNAIINQAIDFDIDNPNYLNNNIPKFISSDFNNSDFIVFLDMIGHHYDIIWSYINELTRLKQIDERSDFGISNNFIWDVLKSFGWDGVRSYDSDLLWEYVFGEDIDGNKKYGIPLKDANNLLWRRILNNLPFILKNKGTSRSLKAIMACYGVSQSTLSIIEFGGPQNPDSGNSTEYTFEDTSYSLSMITGNSVTIPWKSVSGYPDAIQLNFKPNLIENSTIISLPGFTLGYTVVGTSDVRFVVNNVAVGSSFKLSIDEYSSLLVNHNGGTSYDIKLRTTDGERILTSVNLTITATIWDTTGTLNIGGNFNGQIDEFRIWKTPLEEEAFIKHVYLPESINGNNYDSSTTDLLFRLDFSFPKNLSTNQLIKNVAISTEYGEPNATAVGFGSNTIFPHQFNFYEKTVTALVPSIGFGYSNKFRFETQFGIDGTILFNNVDNNQINGVNLSHNIRSTKKSYDKSPIDSNRLGIFLSPVKELNMDIIKTFGNFYIDDYIGNPSDEYKDKYSELEKLRKYYFERINLNINEYIQLVKYIDKSLFDVMASLVPARAKVTRGLLIEPHFLERSKIKWQKPVSIKNDYSTTIEYIDETNIGAKYNTFTASIYDVNIGDIFSKYNTYSTIIKYTNTFEPDFTLYDVNAHIGYDMDNITSGSVHFYSASIFVPFGQVPPNSKSYGSNPLSGFNQPQMKSTLSREVDSVGSLEKIGFDTYTNIGYGIYGDDGYTTYNNKKARAFLIEKEISRVISTQTAGWPVIGAQLGEQVVYEDVVVTDTKKEITILTNQDLIESGYSIPVSGDIISVTPIDKILSSHYKFKSNLTEGFAKSFFKGSVQRLNTTPDGLPPVEIFNTNANVLRVTNTGARGSGEPILSVD